MMTAFIVDIVADLEIVVGGVLSGYVMGIKA